MTMSTMRQRLIPTPPPTQQGHPSPRSRRRRAPPAAGVGFGVGVVMAVAVAAAIVASTTNSGTTHTVHALTVLSPPSPALRGTTTTTPTWNGADDVWTSSAPSVRSDQGMDVELPNFASIFREIQQVSPLAQKVMTKAAAATSQSPSPFSSDDLYQPTPRHPWKVVDHNSNGVRIDKIDNYQGRAASAPLLRFRTTLQGPCLGECFARFIMDHAYRQQWDAQIDQVYEAHSVSQHLSQVQQAMDASRVQVDDITNWGTCSKFGVGYCRTKASIVSPREQLTLCGIQDYPDGSCVIWGVEMDPARHDHLMPPETTSNNNSNRQRLTRAKSHLFCTTLSPRVNPTSSSSSSSSTLSFDVEYLLQLEIGGKIPTWISGPVVTENVKQLIKCASHFFAGTDPHRGLEAFLLQRANDAMATATTASSSMSSSLLRPVETYMEGRHGLLMTF